MNPKQIAQEVIKAADSLRKKYITLTRGETDESMLLSKHFLPLTKPLEEIKETIKPIIAQQPLDMEAKAEPRDRLVEPYLRMIKEGKSGELDSRYGISIGASGKMSIGDSAITIDDNDDLHVKNKMFKATPGLYELLFLKEPSAYSEKDLEQYRDILVLTNAHYRHYSSEKPISANKGRKYTKIISDLFKKRGSGFMHVQKPIYEYYNDPNELVDRLRLLIASSDSGNDSHYNEVESIIEELKEGGYII